jgi:hypothetical protein
MDNETISAIILAQLSDSGMSIDEPEAINVAISYYHQWNSMPDIEYVINTVFNNQQLNNQPLNNQPLNNQQLNNQPPNNQQLNNQPAPAFDVVPFLESSVQQNVNPAFITNSNHDYAQTVPMFNHLEEDELSSSEEVLSDNEEDQLNELSYSSSSSDSLDSVDDTDLPVISMDDYPAQSTPVPFAGDTSIPQNMIDVKKILSNTEVDKIKLIFVNDLADLTANKECLNCYDEFVVTDIVRILPCGHSFHRLCIDYQLQKESHLCPLCKIPTGEHKFINL